MGSYRWRVRDLASLHNLYAPMTEHMTVILYLRVDGFAHMRKLTMTTSKLVLSSGLALSLIAGLASAQPGSADAQGWEGKADQGKHHAKRMAKVAKRLDLSDEQQAQWQAMHEEFRTQTQGLRDEMQRNRQALREQSQQGDYDADAIEELAKQRGDLVEQLTVAKAEHRASLKSILNDEQIEQMQEFKDKRKHKRWHKRHGGNSEY